MQEEQKKSNGNSECSTSSTLLLESSIEKMLLNLADTGYSISQDVFPQELCMALRNEIIQLKTENNLKKASIGTNSQKQIVSEIRGDFIHWLDDSSNLSEASQKALQILETIRIEFQKVLFLSLKRFEAHFAYYPPGAGYHKHWDNPQGHSHRRITFVLYLNDWQEGHGGELAVFDPNVPENLLFNLAPQMGTLILFRSELFPHQVLESHQNRFSLTGWYRTDL